MRKLIFFLLPTLLFLESSCATTHLPSSADPRKPSSEKTLSQSHVFMEKVRIGNLPYEQRVGLFLEPDQDKFKGCILYLQGLGDSIQNHYPLFNALTSAGYRVLAFDYLGQGGSGGSMAATRIDSLGDPFPKRREYEIGNQAKWVWKKFSQSPDPLFGRSCNQSRKMVIGWSTGGLAAYKLAHEKWADAVALIAPGIIPNLCVGEAGHSSLPKCAERNLTLEKIISLGSLTSANYSNGLINPHIDPVRPSNFLSIKEFAINLVSTAYLKARNWKIDPTVSGTVFLSGKEDSYVDRDWTNSVLQKNAPQFTVFTYDGSLHEIDNEVPEIANDMQLKAVQFFDSLSNSR